MTFGWVAERIGRVPAARITIALYAVMSLACAFTQNYDQLFWCRFVEGIGLGGEIPVASTYISEILRAERRGGSFLSYQMIFPIGLLGAGVAGAIVVPRFGWQWMFIIGAVPALVALVLQRYCPESPRWLASKGRLSEADAVLTEIERIVSRDGARPLPPVPDPACSRWQRDALAGAVPGPLSLAHAARLGAVGVVLHRLLRAAGLDPDALSRGLSPAAAAGAELRDRRARRQPDRLAHLRAADRPHRPAHWFIGAFFLIAAGLIELWAIGANTAFGMLLGYGFCSMWLGSINMSIFLYTAEIYPTRMRALGVSWASFWLRIAATVGPLIVGFALPRYGIGGVFLVFSIFAIIGCSAAFFMVETRRRVLEEVSP